jgi:DNA-directed RNA polymerase subunit RPC12/RpoP
MKPRKIEIFAKVGGFEISYGVFRIVPYAKEMEPETERRCPKCNIKPAYTQPLYKCSQCGQEWHHWGGLTRYVQGTNVALIPKPLEPESDRPRRAVIVKMERTKFAEKEGDAGKETYGIMPEDPKAAQNLMNLVVAHDRLDKVIILTWNDTTEEIKALLTLSESNRILVQNIIPANLAEIRETAKVDLTKINENDLAQAKVFINAIPDATEDTFTAHDYRIEGLEAVARKSENAVALEKILAAQKQAEPIPVPVSKPKKAAKKG